MECFLCGTAVSRPEDVVTDAQGQSLGWGVCQHHRENGPVSVLMDQLESHRQALREIAAAHGIPIGATTTEAYNILRDRAARELGLPAPRRSERSS